MSSQEMRHREQLNAALKRKLLHDLETPGIVSTAIAGLHLVRREDDGTSENCFEKPLVGLVIQGTKHSSMGGREYIYTENQSVVAGVDMPISSYVMNATRETPFLFLYLYLDRELLGSLTLEMRQGAADIPTMSSSVSIADTDADILEMFLRILTLLEKPEQLPMRAPMMLRELHYLLLLSPHGAMLRQLSTPGTRNNQVVQAIGWIRENYKAPMRIETLARQVNMSAANLHRHFKLLTGLSPLQYQKQLRLHEARRLMLMENERASCAALSVGYESVTQFTREYKRVFGEPPLRDMNRRRSSAA